MLAAASPGRMDVLGHWVPDLEPFPVEMIGRGWVSIGTSLAPPTTSLHILSSVLAAPRDGPSPRTAQRRKAQVDFSSPRSVLSPPMRLPTCLPPSAAAAGPAWRHGVLLRRCLAGNMIWLYDFNLSVLPTRCSHLTRTCYLHPGRRWLSSQAPAPPPGAPHSRASFPFAC